MQNKPNKLQIRALVFDIIKSYNSVDDIETNLHRENLKKLNSIENKKFVCEILLKELANKNPLEFDIIKYLLADFAELEMVESCIWEILYNPDISDRQKEIYLQFLRALGGKVDIDELMNCVSDAEALADEQTQDLLETAAVNPEAQIDFLDFLTSLRTKEQHILIQSLFEDYKGDEMANLLSPCLRMDLDNSIKEEVISIMGKIPSYLSVKPLKSYISTVGDEELKRKAILALNQIKNAGIDIDNDEILNYRENEICRETSFYKAFLSQVDGCGNQGMIFSRITNKDKIIMFSTVINLTDGIMDCFGLYEISINEFLKVITRFRNNDMVVPITAEVAKYKLTEAEKRSTNMGSKLPYEYYCWSAYTCDIETNPIDYNALLTEEIKVTKNELNKIYDTGIFDSWFFEYDDNINAQNLINLAINIVLNADDPITQIENNIDEMFFKIYTSDKIEEYSKMLLDCSFIFYLNGQYDISNITANISKDITNGNYIFLRDVLKRSILQYLANIVAEDEKEDDNIFTANKNEKKLSPEDAYKILKSLEEEWDNE